MNFARKTGVAWTLALAAWSIFLYIVVNGLLWQSKAKEFFSVFSYYIMLSLIVLLAIQVFKLSSMNFSVGSWLKKNSYDMMFILTLIFLSLWWLRPEMRVLADEMNLVSVSRSFFYTKEPLIVSQSLFDFGTWQPISWNYPIRPLMFPFVLHFLHLIFGYQLENAFILNNLLFGLLLAAIYFGFRHYSNRIIAASSTLLVCSIPLARLCATSAGFDLMAVTCLVLLTLISVSILNGNKQLSSLNWCLWLIFINIRYENIALLLVATIFFIYHGHLTRRNISEDPLPYIFTPIALIPLALQFIISQGSYENPRGTSLFSVAHFFDHLFLLLRNQFRFDMELPYNHIINVLSLLLLIFVLFLSKNTWQLIKKNRPVIIFVGILWAIPTGIFLAHFMGNYSLPTQFRFFLSYSIFAAIFPGLLLLLKPGLFRPSILFIFSCCCWVFYQAQPAIFPPDQGLTKIAEAEFLRSFMKKNDFKNAVVVSEDPALFVGMNYSAVDFKYFEEQREKFFLDLKKKSFSDILVIRHEFDANNVKSKAKAFVQKILEDEQIKTPLNLDILETTRLDDHTTIVVSRISNER